MSNILIIKHGSLGDIVQISGALRDIRETLKNDKIFILTTFPYIDLLSSCPFIDGALIDQRSPRWNIFYLAKLKKMVEKYNFASVFDLQNSSRTSFYRKFLFNIKNWSSTETKLAKGTKKKELDQDSVLTRFKLQLENSNIIVKNTLKPDFSWACANVDQIVNKYSGKKLVLLLPFCSPQLSHKKWPYYNELIKIIKSKNSNFEIIISPGANELQEAKKIDAISITNSGKALNIMELAGLVKKSSFIIGNDTGPAHIAAHLNKKGVVLFGYHTSAKKVSIETDQFRALTSKNLKELSADMVYSAIKKELDLIIN